jgi:hypothetical protein
MNHSTIESKAIKICPKNIIVNRTNHDMRVWQAQIHEAQANNNAVDDSTLVESNNRIPFFWSDGKNEKIIKVCLLKEVKLEEKE